MTNATWGDWHRSKYLTSIQVGLQLKHFKLGLTIWPLLSLWSSQIDSPYPACMASSPTCPVKWARKWIRLERDTFSHFFVAHWLNSWLDQFFDGLKLSHTVQPPPLWAVLQVSLEQGQRREHIVRWKVEGRRSTQYPRSRMNDQIWHALSRVGYPWRAQPEARVVYKEIHQASAYCKSAKCKERDFSGWILVAVVSAWFSFSCVSF